MLYLLHRFLEGTSFGKIKIVRYAICAQPIGTGVLKFVREDPSTNVEVWHPGGLDDPCQLFPRPSEVIAARQADGAVCYLARVKGSFAGYIWIAHGAYSEDEVRCRYLLDDPASCVWDYDVFVVPRFRLGRTMSRLWKAVDADLAEKGFKWTFSRISTFNSGSLTSHKRLGAVVWAMATFLVVGPLQVALITRKPYISVSILSGSGPSLRLTRP